MKTIEQIQREQEQIQREQEWYRRGVRDGREKVVRGIIEAMGLDYDSLDRAQISDVEIEKRFMELKITERNMEILEKK